MRTRRQGKTVTPLAATAASPGKTEFVSSPGAASAAGASSAAAHSPSPSPAPAPAASTVVTVSKMEGPTVRARPDRDDDDGGSTTMTTTRSSSTSSKLPEPLRFPLVAVLSLALSTLGYALTWPHTRGVLAAHARMLDTWAEVGVVAGWRILELALAWFGNFDGYEVTALNLLSHGPPLYLLYAHYETPAPALALTLAIETLAAYVPFRLLRPLSPLHADPSRAPNAEIAGDGAIAALTSLLAAAVYTVALLAAYATFLPTRLVVHFDGLPSLRHAAYDAYGVRDVGGAYDIVARLLPVTLALGWAARAFVFTPGAAAPPDTEQDARDRAFDPVSASLAETVRWNVWGWPTPTKVVLRRTALLMAVTGVNTFLQTWLTVRGVEATGAAAWAGVWVFASAVAGLGLGAVGSA
ncbi:hypothetical protein GGR56DRAFT_305056 [Xylariaceae sp. FL0804]|nr:hypothetical protein GGR56DRAFT_305056 [Xylariaceae sp. FL0804]